MNRVFFSSLPGFLVLLANEKLLVPQQSDLPPVQLNKDCKSKAFGESNMSTRFNRLGPGVWITLVALAVFSIPFITLAQHQPPPPVTPSTVPQPPARVEGEELPVPEACQICLEKPSAPVPDTPPALPCAGETPENYAAGPQETEVLYRLGHMMHNPDEYLGKTITVDGEMHRQFTDRVFTIENDGFWRDKDMLVISLVPMENSVIPLQGSFDRGKQVRVTGVLRPYDRAKLECLYGPLDLESREGKSFTKNPVLIIGYRPPAKKAAIIVEPPTAPPPLPEPAAAAPAPEPTEEVAELVIQEVPAPAPAPEPKALPRTAGNLPSAALAGVFFLLAACFVRVLGRGAVRGN
jgi:hypothetical protein